MTDWGRYWYCGIWCWGGELLSNTWHETPATDSSHLHNVSTILCFIHGEGGSHGIFPVCFIVELWIIFCGVTDPQPPPIVGFIPGPPTILKGSQRGKEVRCKIMEVEVGYVIKVNSLRKGKMSKMRLFLNFWSFTVTKRFDFFKLISLYWLIYFLLVNQSLTDASAICCHTTKSIHPC